jgi:hypothetical protein
VEDESNLSVERYDVASNTWTLVTDMRESRYTHSAVTIRSADTDDEQDLFDALITEAATEGP